MVSALITIRRKKKEREEEGKEGKEGGREEGRKEDFPGGPVIKTQ